MTSSSTETEWVIVLDLSRQISSGDSSGKIWFKNIDIWQDVSRFKKGHEFGRRI